MSVTYKVVATGFYNGKLYSPTHPRRNKLTVEKAFDKKTQPSWLELTVTETKAQAKARKAAAKQLQSDVEAARKDIQDASFLGTGETASKVETL